VGKNAQQKTTPILREFSSGGVVFKNKSGQVLWLLAATVPNEVFPNIVWRLPKGWIDDTAPGIPGPMASGRVKADEDSLRDTALREVREEGGVDAKIIEKIGTVKYFYTFPGKGKILKFVTFYLMEYAGDRPEGFDGETSEVAWLPFEAAIKKLSFGVEKEVLKEAKELLSP
jgi:8-oxo-dGTP pyrophosphatase MutT (NUDIX family)